MEAGRQNRMRAGVQMPAKVEILDMIEEGNRVAVRWQVTATARNGNPYEGRVLQSIALRTGASPRIGALLHRHFGRGAIRRTQCLVLTNARRRAYFSAAAGRSTGGGISSFMRG